jgi:Domain of unknown function (DUF4111)
LAGESSAVVAGSCEFGLVRAYRVIGVEIDARIAVTGGLGVSSFLAVAVASWKSALGRNLAGVYVQGSLCTGAFNPRISDIDVMVTTRVLTDSATNERLHEVQRAMLGRGHGRWADMLEAIFVPVKALGMPGVPGVSVLELHPDEGFKIQRLGPDFLIQKRLLREHGITLFGPKIAKVVAPVTNGELRDAVIGNLREWWMPQLEYPGLFLKRSYQAYAVLTMCRALCLLVTGEVVTKPQAAAWALHGPYLEAWQPLIESARAYPGGSQPDQRAGTLNFIRFALEEAGIGH